MLFWSSILWLVFEQRGGRKREWGKKNSFTNPHCFKMSEHFFRIPEPFLWKNSCFLKPFNCVVQRSRVWKNLYFLRCLKCVFQKSSALPWHCLYWVAKVQSKTWAVCLGIACIEFVKLMIQSIWFYLIGNCITIVRDDEIGFDIQHDPSPKTTHWVWGTVRILCK